VPYCETTEKQHNTRNKENKTQNSKDEKVRKCKTTFCGRKCIMFM